MKVFISWSGDRAKALALELREWIPHIAQIAEPFVSKEDIPVGDPWFAAIEAAMAESPAGIIVVTPENQHAQWLNYEAGAMSRYMGKRACPVLLDMSDPQLTGPLKNLHVAEATDEGFLKLFHDLFDEHVRPDLIGAAYAHVRKNLVEAAAAAAALEHEKQPERDPADKLDEILEVLRQGERTRARAESQADLSRIYTDPFVSSLIDLFGSVGVRVLSVLPASHRGQPTGVAFQLDPGERAVRHAPGELADLAAEHLFHHSSPWDSVEVSTSRGTAQVIR